MVQQLKKKPLVLKVLVSLQGKGGGSSQYLVGIYFNTFLSENCIIAGQYSEMRTLTKSLHDTQSGCFVLMCRGGGQSNFVL